MSEEVDLEGEASKLASGHPFLGESAPADVAAIAFQMPVRVEYGSDLEDECHLSIDERRKLAEQQAGEDILHPMWAKHKKHVFILSSAGKPIFSRYGDEGKLSDFYGIMSAIVSFVKDKDDELQYIAAGRHRIVFAHKKHLHLVCVAKTGEPVKILARQLDYLYCQIISILTAGIMQIFDDRAHFDLRNLMGGTENVLTTLIHRMDNEPCFLLDSVECLRLNAQLRIDIGNVLLSIKCPDLLFALLVARHQLVSLIRPKRLFLQPSDLLVLLNFVNSSASFRSSESWTPICLPKFNDKGFVYAYVGFLATDICLILITVKNDHFYHLASCREQIDRALSENGAIRAIQESLERPSYRMEETRTPNILHFIFRSDSIRQFTRPMFEIPYLDRHDQKRLFRRYQNAFDATHKHANPHKVFFHVTEKDTLLAWTTPDFQMYATFTSITSKTLAVQSCNRLLRWIKANEDNLFILNPPVW